GNVVCNMKDKRLEGIKLLLIQLQTPEGDNKGGLQVALDGIGVSGVGDRVYLTKGKEAGLPFADKTVPADLAVVGIIDAINLCKE
ncbi:MAG: EutN/CcmL family microcompartment protein, partial [Ruminiclostridium sp.]